MKSVRPKYKYIFIVMKYNIYIYRQDYRTRSYFRLVLNKLKIMGCPKVQAR